MAAISSNGLGGGNWSDFHSWSGLVVPVAADTVTVVAGDTMTFDQNDTGANTCLTLSVTGTVKFSRAMTTQMTLGASGTATCLTFAASTSVFDMGSAADPIPAAYTCTLKLDTNAEDGSAVLYSNVFASWKVCGDPTYNATSTTLNGFATGTYNTTLTSTASAAATTIVLTDDLGLRSGGGDLIAVWEADSTASTGNQSNQSHTEYFTTSSYNAGTKTVTLPSGLVNAHQAGGRVINLSRNVIIKGTSTSRRPGITASTTTGSTGVSPGMDWRHCQLFEIGRINNANTPGAAFSSMNMIGLSAYITSTKEVGTVYATTAVNTHFDGIAFADALQVGSTQFTMSYCTSRGVTNRSFTGGTLSNCNFGAGFIPLSSLNSTVINSCTFEESLYALNLGAVVTFNSCTFKNISNVFSSLTSSIVTSCTSTNCGVIMDSNNRDIIMRGGNMAFTSSESANTNDVRQPFSRYARRQETTQGTYTVYNAGTLTRYTSGTVPDAIFPVPTGSTYTQRLVPGSAIANIPVTLNYIIAVTAGTSFTFTVPIMPRFTGTFTTDDIYLSVAQPGSATLIRSLQTLGASGAWTFFTATGTAVSDGPMVCSVVIKKGGGNYYIDFPLAMASSGYAWVDGLPNENFVPLSGTPAADVWNFPTASATTSGTTGKVVKDTDLSNLLIKDKLS